MTLTELLEPGAVRVLGDVSSKKRLMHAISEVASTFTEIAPQRIFDALQDRESLGPTGAGHGVALPHARLDEVDRVWAVFFRLDRPIDFEAADRQPVDLVVALIAPQNSGVEHLKALALVSRTLRDSDLCAKLRANSDPSVLFSLLTEAQTSRAA